MMAFSSRIATGVFRIWIAMSAAFLIGAVASTWDAARWTRLCRGPSDSVYSVRFSDGRTVEIVGVTTDGEARAAALKAASGGELTSDQRYLLMPEIAPFGVSKLCEPTRAGYLVALLSDAQIWGLVWLMFSAFGWVAWWIFRGFFPSSPRLQRSQTD